jgi:uncharacterized protein YjbI with pentapeptide repeats
MARAKYLDDPMFLMLRRGDMASFNAQRAAGASCDLRDADLRGMDLREIEAAGLDLSGCYLRQADLRGVDFSQTRLEGASLLGAKIAGALFPAELGADEIELSLNHGTRMRYR